MKQDFARYNMLSQQIRACNVQDERILNAIEQTPREIFVPETYRSVAFADWQIPIGHDQVMMLPKDEANCLQALNIQPHECVLEIGTGTGYLTALLAKMAKYVYSVDIFDDFILSAKQKLDSIQLHNFTLECVDAAQGWSKYAALDAICITGSLRKFDQNWCKLLSDHGRIFGCFGQKPAMHATLITKLGKKHRIEKLYEMSLPALLNSQMEDEFYF